MKLPKYNAALREPEIISFWQENNIYKADPHGDNTYRIDTPPPTVSGKMHVGHAFSYTKGDIIARFQRMQGKNVFYPFGTDDNGIPTEHLVEKREEIDSNEMPRSEFLKVCEDTLEEIKPRFVQDWQRLGSSCDFEAGYSTLDENSVKTSQQSFLELVRDGYCERRKGPVAWCTSTQTAISQAEFESVEKSTYFVDLAFEAGGDTLFVSTTRPEMLPSCVALFAHPDDDRYEELEGRTADVPLFDFEVPILFDEDVDPDKGTGLMMVCTFGDKEDVEKWRRHDLPLKPLITKDGTLNERGGHYSGLTVVQARNKIIDDLRNRGYLVRQDKIQHNVNVYERSGTPIEFLVTDQWFVNVLDYKEELLEQGRKVDWNPEHMQKRYENWVENLEWDWCISRQRHFGVPIPAWFSEKTGEPILPSVFNHTAATEIYTPSNLPGGHTADDIVPSNDVFDTWHTSSLTPQIALGWAEDEERFEDSFPEKLRHQGHDIIRTWAFYTIVKSYYHHHEIPWEQIMVSGFVQDPNGEKMSKSKGNTVDPKRMMRKYSADSLRFAAAGTTLGEDVPFKEKELKTGEKTVNKYWNASRFVAMNLDEETSTDYDDSELTAVDKWMLGELHGAVQDVKDGYEAFDFPKARRAAEEFFWKTFCDNYLELVKHRVYEEEDENVLSVLKYAIHVITKLFAPTLPFVTEELYQHLLREEEEAVSVHISSWPEGGETYDEQVKQGKALIEALRLVRKFKSEHSLSLKEELEEVTVRGPNYEELLEDMRGALKSTGNIAKLTVEDDDFVDVIVAGYGEE